MVELFWGLVDGPDLHVLDAPLGHFDSTQVGDGMKRLYFIESMAWKEGDHLKQSPLCFKFYVTAECPYEALFYFQNHLKKLEGVQVSFDPRIHLLDPERFDPERHSIEDIRMASLQGRAVWQFEKWSRKEGLLLSA